VTQSGPDNATPGSYGTPGNSPPPESAADAALSDTAADSPSDEGPPASLGEQIGRTRTSFMRLIQAHIGLLRAEIDEIMAEVKVLASQAGAILALALFTSTLLYVGGFLFLGEWLFGSIGWGLAHGVLFGVAVIISLVLAMLGARGSRLALGFVLALVLVVAVALLCGSNVAYNAAAGTASGLAQPLGTPGVVALLGGVIVGAILFTLLFGRLSGRNAAIGGFFLGAILGAIVGWLIAGAPWTWPPAVGFAITLGLIAWPMLSAILALPGLNPEDRFAKLYPRQSIESFEETRTFLEEQWANRRPKLGKS